jgi:hypothetical protein
MRGRFGKAIALGRTLLQIVVTYALLWTGLLMASVHVWAEQAPGSLPTARLEVQSTVAETVLPVNYRFHIGDDARFAGTEFNDDVWPVFESSQTDPALSGKTFQIIWYRTHLRVPAASHDLGLYLLHFHTAGQLFVNGTLVDSWGRQAPGWGRFSI